MIIICIQALLDCAEVNRIFYNFNIVRDIQLVWVNRLVKDSALVQSPELMD